MTKRTAIPVDAATVTRDRGSASVMVVIYLTIVLASCALIFDGGNYFVAERRASNVAEGAARAGTATGSPSTGLSAEIVRAAVVEHARLLGIPSSDVAVGFPTRDSVTVSITECRNAVFTRFTGSATLCVTAVGTAELDYT